MTTHRWPFRRSSIESAFTQAAAYAKRQMDANASANLAVEIVDLSRRSLEQNAKLWPMLDDVANQVDWYGKRLTKEEWKDVFTAALKRNKVVPGLDGGFVVVGASTRRMTKAEMSDLLELIYAFGAEHGVRWTEPEAA